MNKTKLSIESTLSWYCKTCGYDMTEDVKKFMRPEARVVILTCSNKHTSRIRYKDGVGEEE